MTRSELRWPQANPRSGPVSLRAFRALDVSMVEELATDPYVPLIGSLLAGAGYLNEGVLRQHQEIGGRRRDMCLYAALRDDGSRHPHGP